MDIMATHPDSKSQQTKTDSRSHDQVEISNAKCLQAVLIGFVMWAILVLIATW